MKTIIKTSVLAALLAISAQASAQSVLLNFDYIAQTNASSTISNGTTVASLGGQSPGWVKVTDLADLNLGDGKTGVRIEAKLQNLTQFGNYGSNTLELNFLGTGIQTGGTDWVNTVESYRNISGNYTLNGGDEGGIEWAEHGSVGSGTVNTANSHRWAFFQQQFNVQLGSWTNDETITFDFINGSVLTAGPNVGQAYNGFSVASLLSSPVANQDGVQPSAYAWLRLQPLAGASGISTDPNAWYRPFMNTANGRLNFLATNVTMVPEADSYAMMLAGLAMMGAIVRRRKSA